jgi:hypothetical protein
MGGNDLGGNDLRGNDLVLEYVNDNYCSGMQGRITGFFGSRFCCD